MLNNNYEKDGQTIYSNDIQVENIEIITQRKNEEKVTNKNREIAKKVRDVLGDDVAFEVSEGLLD